MSNVLAKGIDLSVHNGKVDFQKVKAAGIKFVMLRLGYGAIGKNPCKMDANFETYLNDARKVGLDVGCYFYSYALSPMQTQAEANWVVKALSKYKGVFTYPVCFDLEDSTQEDLGKETLSLMVNLFCSTLEKAGYYTALYSNLAWLNYRLNPTTIKHYDVWLAQWASKPRYKSSFGLWQYSNVGKVNGITTDVDLNYAYTDYPSLIKSKGLNGFPKSTTNSSNPSADKLQKGELVKIKRGAKTAAGSPLENYVLNSVFKVQSINGNKITLVPASSRAITINLTDLSKEV